MGSKAQAKKSAEFAKIMKNNGIRRNTGRCPVCNKVVALPLNRHLFNCG